MTKSKAVIHTLVLTTLASHLGIAGAACMNPETQVSGYTVPLALETREAEAIVIGRVVSEQPLQEDRSDPDGVTAYDVSVQVLVRLKGNLPNVFVLRNENTSSRYPIGVGEKHVLFVSRSGQALWIDGCGNSSAMPEGKQVLKQIEAQLKSQG